MRSAPLRAMRTNGKGWNDLLLGLARGAQCFELTFQLLPAGSGSRPDLILQPLDTFPRLGA